MLKQRDQSIEKNEISYLVASHRNGSRHLKRTYPLSYDEYVEAISQIAKQVSPNAHTSPTIRSKYEHYLHNFTRLISLPKLNLTRDLDIFSKRSNNIQYFLDRGWSKEEASSELSKRQSIVTVDKIAKRRNVSINEAKAIFDDIQHKSQITRERNPEYASKLFGKSIVLSRWIETINPKTGLKYTVEEAKLEISNMIKARAPKAIVTKRRLESFNSIFSLKYYLDKGLSIEEAISSQHLRQSTNTLERYIEKFGEELGKNKFEERQAKRLATLDSKTDEEKLDILIRKTRGFKFYSNASTSFFSKIVEILNTRGVSAKCYYAETEAFIYDRDRKKIFFYDFYIPDIKLYIEFNGIKYHPNIDKLTKEQWKEWKNPFSGESADFAYAKDQHKLSLITERGGSYIIVWEDDPIAQTIANIVSIIQEKLANNANHTDRKR